jgi:hypothetical protein
LVPPLAAVAAALALAALPKQGVLVPGKSLGGVRLGMTPAQVRATWGSTYGVCRSCPDRTWYFTYAEFTPQGAGVAFRRGRVVAVFTVWSPAGWQSSSGLRIGDAEGRVAGLYGPLLRFHCGSYDALVESNAGVRSAFYLYGGKVWGLGLSSAAAPVCH